MDRCEGCRKLLNNLSPHFFCGYDYAVEYCHRCCPVEMDGQKCESDAHDLKSRNRIFEKPQFVMAKVLDPKQVFLMGKVMYKSREYYIKVAEEYDRYRGKGLNGNN